MKPVPTYACVEKEEPPDWIMLQVRDLDTNELRKDVVEINTKEGWAEVYDREASPCEHGWPTKRITGRFTLEWQEGYNPTNG